jgi:hypothetical protein
VSPCTTLLGTRPISEKAAQPQQRQSGSRVFRFPTNMTFVPYKRFGINI